LKYTVRFAHMAERPKYKVGDIIKRGDIIGIMGSTGQSTAKHVHADCVEGEQKEPYKLVDLSNGNKTPSKEQLDYFIDDELFGVEPVKTTQYDDPEYRTKYGKWHKGYDVVPEDREHWVNGVKVGSDKHSAICWNRSMNGKVSLVGFDQNGYGNYIYITFEKKEKKNEKDTANVS
jgi:hypothetical protein